MGGSGLTVAGISLLGLSAAAGLAFLFSACGVTGIWYPLFILPVWGIALFQLHLCDLYNPDPNEFMGTFVGDQNGLDKCRAMSWAIYYILLGVAYFAIPVPLYFKIPQFGLLGLCLSQAATTCIGIGFFLFMKVFVWN
jgi:hypothetical protein